MNDNNDRTAIMRDKQITTHDNVSNTKHITKIEVRRLRFSKDKPIIVARKLLYNTHEYASNYSSKQR